MSDNFEMLVDVEATIEEADRTSRSVLERFRSLGLITDVADSDCTLGGIGYRPGPAIADLYVIHGRELEFWTLVNCGVEPHVGRGFNEWALGPVFQGFTCFWCGATIEAMLDDEFGDSVWRVIAEWLDQSGASLLKCPHCGEQRSIAEWPCKPPLGFGNLSFTFWNWPQLNSPSWKIDIASIVRETTGHKIVRTYGHL
jgi:hypothetical protein